MNILSLSQAPQHLELMCQWHQVEWSHLNPSGTLEQRIERRREHLGDDPIPSTYIGLIEGELAGSASIVQYDMDTHKELFPWLASVFVKPALRKQGIGQKLVLHVMQQARELGVKELYLFTDKQKEFYKKLGWSVWSEETYRNIDVTIMSVRF